MSRIINKIKQKALKLKSELKPELESELKSELESEPDYFKNPKCKGFFDETILEYGCDYNTTLSCDECKYGLGRKNPEAKRNQL